MNLAGKTMLVVGLGRTGLAVARFLSAGGAAVTATDSRLPEDLGAETQKLTSLGVTLELGEHRIDSFRKVDLIVLSPGVPHTIEPIRLASRAGVPVISEIELASRFIRTPVVAVTGTNGKTTTTELLGEMLRASGRNVFVGGNIGNPLIGYAGGRQAADVVVAEISSFQLDTMQTFRPQVGLLLNITEDHLDRYPDFDAYVRSKMRLFENQRATDIAILNGSDPIIRRFAPRIKSRLWFFGERMADEPGADIESGSIRILLDKSGGAHPDIPQVTAIGPEPVHLDLSMFKLIGAHNRENVCAAALGALAAGGTPRGIQAALERFSGSPHRIEHVATIDGVDYVNDSKATNVDAVARALECYSAPVVLIMGGLDKGSNFHALSDCVRRQVRVLIVMGAAGDKIADALSPCVRVIRAHAMDDAVRTAAQTAVPGEVVLLSPGCASFDTYTGYAERGEDFRHEVMRLEAGTKLS